MRKLLRFGLVSVLTFAAIIILGLVPGGLTATSDVEVGQISNLKTQESTDSNAVEVDGIRFEILISESLIAIPEKKPGTYTPVKLSLRITNNTSTSLRFTKFDSLFPVLAELDGQVIQMQGGRNWTIPPTISDCPLVRPRESLTFSLDTRLLWQNNKLRLGGSDGFGGLWFFDNLMPGRYKIQLLYGSRKWTPIYDPEIQKIRVLQDLWPGQVATPLQEISLIQH